MSIDITKERAMQVAIGKERDMYVMLFGEIDEDNHIGLRSLIYKPTTADNGILGHITSNCDLSTDSYTTADHLELAWYDYESRYPGNYHDSIAGSGPSDVNVVFVPTEKEKEKTNKVDFIKSTIKKIRGTLTVNLNSRLIRARDIGNTEFSYSISTDIIEEKDGCINMKVHWRTKTLSRLNGADIFETGDSDRVSVTFCTHRDKNGVAKFTIMVRFSIEGPYKTPIKIIPFSTNSESEHEIELVKNMYMDGEEQYYISKADVLVSETDSIHAKTYKKLLRIWTGEKRTKKSFHEKMLNMFDPSVEDFSSSSKKYFYNLDDIAVRLYRPAWVTYDTLGVNHMFIKDAQEKEEKTEDASEGVSDTQNN